MMKEAIKKTLQRMKRGGKKRPYVVGVVTSSLDGRLTLRKGESSYSLLKFIPNKYYEELFFPLRKNADAIMVGTETVIIDNPTLTTGTGKKHRPLRVILDRKGRIPLSAKVFNQEAKTLLLSTEFSAKDRLRKLEKNNIETFILSKGRTIDLNKLLLELKRRKIQSLLLEGGGKLISSFLKKDLLDELWLQILPLLIGGKETPLLFQFEKQLLKTMYLKNVFRIDQATVLSYTLKRKYVFN